MRQALFAPLFSVTGCDDEIVKAYRQPFGNGFQLLPVFLGYFFSLSQYPKPMIT
jgi:hypothetical protein